MRILIAEDDTTFRLLLTGLLRKLGHEPMATEDGVEAWKAYQNAYFPVLITDWLMPNMDGMNLTANVRAKPHEHYTYVIMLASKGGKEAFLEAMKAGVDDFVPKPPDEEELIARLLVAERIVGLQNHVRRLESIMAVCSYCKNVRSEGNRWVDMESYVARQLNAEPSHTICPECYRTHISPELERLGIRPDEKFTQDS